MISSSVIEVKEVFYWWPKETNLGWAWLRKGKAITTEYYRTAYPSNVIIESWQSTQYW